MNIIKELKEQRAEKSNAMESILNTAKTEKRALTEDEIKSFDALEAEIKSIDETIDRETRSLKVLNSKQDDAELTVEERDVKDFASYIRNVVEHRDTDTNMTKTDNGAVIPQTIVKKIIEKLEEISPIYKWATHYDVPGTITIPVVDASDDDVTVAYATEFDELTSHSNKFASIQLTGFLYASLVKVSKSLLRNSDFKLTDFVVKRMAQKIAKFVEKECIYGTSEKIAGIAGSYDSTNMKVTFGATNKITGDELIELQGLIPDVYQGNACWIMNRKTRTMIRKLKDGEGNYLLNRDITSPFGFSLLGRPVYCSDNVYEATAANAGKIGVLYGDFSGLAVKESEKPEIQILLEKFATQHAIGVCVYGELDAKVEDKQKIACGILASA